MSDTLVRARGALGAIGWMALAGVSASAQAVEIQGHRGARGLLPENTVAAFERALELGVDVLELDVGITRDGVPVVHHDRRLNPERTRDGNGAWLAPPGPLLQALDLEMLAAFDVGRAAPGSKTARRFPDQASRDGARVPTLADVLALARRPGAGRLRFSVETKLSPLAPDETLAPAAFARAVVGALRTAGLSERAQVQSFDWRTLAEVRRLAPEIPTACLTAERTWLDNLERGRPSTSPWTAGLDIDTVDGSTPRLVHAAGCAVWSPYFRDLTAPRLAEARELGLKVVVWTVNDANDMVALARLGVDGIITDYPERAIQVLARYRCAR